MPAPAEEKIQEAIRLYNEDETLTVTQIAKNLGIPTTTLRRIFLKRGVPARPRKKDPSTEKKRKSRMPKVPESEADIKALFKRYFDNGDEDYKSVALKTGWPIYFVKQVYEEWIEEQKILFQQRLANTAVDFSKYLTKDKLNDFKKQVQVGDEFIVLSPEGRIGGNYDLQTEIGKKIKVTVTGIYPNFAMTDHGAWLWVDLWKASQR